MNTARGDHRLRLFRFAAPLLLVLALAAGLAFQALAAERSRRTAVQRTLGDYADFAAFILASAARQELERRLLYGFGPIRGHVPAPGVPLPPPSALARDRVEANRCVASGVSSPSYIRLELPSKAMTVEGAPLPAATAAWLADTLAAAAQALDRRESLLGQMVADDHDAGVIAYSVMRDTAGTAIAAYAKTSCLFVDKQSVFGLAQTPVLPPTLTGGLPNDSLVSLRVTDPHGHILYASPRQYTSRVTGEEVSSPQWGQLRLTVTVRPDVADRLVIGGVGYSRMPLALLLLLLIVLFAGLAFAQLRKQQEVMRLRESFISSVSHELRTPLQQILLFSELLRMDKLEVGERRHSIEVVERETRRLINLVENVLRFSRASRGKDPLTIEPVALDPLVRDAMRAFELLAKANDVSIALEVERPVDAMVDANAVRRVLLNLLDNAVKYGPPGQTVTVRITANERSAVLTVDDQGPGVPPADRTRVWEPFRRLDREERAVIAGSGMGLAIVHELVERMNGTVRIEDAAGTGARFIVELPRLQP